MITLDPFHFSFFLLLWWQVITVCATPLCEGNILNQNVTYRHFSVRQIVVLNRRIKHH
jgi:hypothetical protein